MVGSQCILLTSTGTTYSKNIEILIWPDILSQGLCAIIKRYQQKFAMQIEYPVPWPYYIQNSTLLQYPCIFVVDNLRNILHFAPCNLHWHCIFLKMNRYGGIYDFASTPFVMVKRYHADVFFYCIVFFIIAILFYSILMWKLTWQKEQNNILRSHYLKMDKDLRFQIHVYHLSGPWEMWLQYQMNNLRPTDH